MIIRWKSILSVEALNTERALIHFNNKLLQKTFTRWNDLSLESKLGEWRQIKYSDAHNTKRILTKTLTAWKMLKLIKIAEQERLNRRLKLKLLVKEVIPDFS